MDLESLARTSRLPGVRPLLALVLILGGLLGFAVGVLTGKDPEHTYLLRQIRASLDQRSEATWSEGAHREQLKEDVYRAVGEALIDWEAASR